MGIIKGFLLLICTLIFGASLILICAPQIQGGWGIGMIGIVASCIAGGIVAKL